MEVLLFKCFLFSILLHIIDDFVFQPQCLNLLKQKSFWVKQSEYSEMYKNDYRMGLFIHGISWALMMMIPVILLVDNIWILIGMILGNVIIHIYVDDAKANKHKLNLIEDQTIHFLQIIVTYLLVYAIYWYKFIY